MKINPVNRINVLISTHANKHKTYLYNEMWDFVKENKLGGSFGNDYITINSMPETLLDKLKKMGIKKIMKL